MKKALFFPIIAMMSVVVMMVLPGYAAARIKTVTIVNHFNDTLNLKVDRNNNVVPDLAESFTLHPGEKVTTRVMTDLPPDADEAYIQAEAQKNPSNETYWGVDSNSIYGYIGTGIAFSWNNHELATLIFCTPEEYRDSGNHCKN